MARSFQLVQPDFANPRVAMFVDFFDREHFPDHGFDVNALIRRQPVEPIAGKVYYSNQGSNRDDFAVPIDGLDRHPTRRR